MGAHHHSEDAWSTDGPGYREDRIYTRSTDAAGHQKHLRVNVPPSIAGQLASLAADGQIPAYRTSQDVVRDAIVHRLHWLAQNQLNPNQDVMRVVDVEMRKCRLDAITREVVELNGMVEAAREAMEQAAHARDVYALFDAITQAQLEAEAVRDPYQTRIFEMVRDYRQRYATELARINEPEEEKETRPWE